MQEETSQPIENEVECLKACINDLTSLLALPAIFTGREPHQIITALLEVLMGVLRLDAAYAAYAAVKDPAGDTTMNTVHLARSENPPVGQLDIEQALNSHFKEDSKRSSLVLKRSAGDVSIVPLRLGFQKELGWIVAASRRVDFPTQTETLLLNVATNLASIGLQEAQLLSEQKRVARELDEKIAERTRELQDLKDQLQRENVALREQVDEASMFEEIVGTGPVLQSVLSRVAKVAPTDSTVLIMGETGTGKELIARAIHKRSVRSACAFVKVSCAAIPPSLIASELFGHEKGAFTGALQRRLGRFELAQGGTLFLDEVGELPAETQISLLRVLQEHEFERVGGTETLHMDVRLIAATNRDLKTAWMPRQPVPVAPHFLFVVDPLDLEVLSFNVHSHTTRFHIIRQFIRNVVAHAFLAAKALRVEPGNPREFGDSNQVVGGQIPDPHTPTDWQNMVFA